MVDGLDQHKLCGFLLAVVSVEPQEALPDPSVQTTLSRFLPFGSVCFLSPVSPSLVAESGVVLTPNVGVNHNGDAVSGSNPVWLEKKRRPRVLKGGASVVRRIHTLVTHKCLRIVARVVGTAVFSRSARAVLLVDVYLPIAMWSGWQFPKSGAMAATLFSHIRFLGYDFLWEKFRRAF